MLKVTRPAVFHPWAKRHLKPVTRPVGVAVAPRAEEAFPTDLPELRRDSSRALEPVHEETRDPTESGSVWFDQYEYEEDSSFCEPMGPGTLPAPMKSNRKRKKKKDPREKNGYRPLAPAMFTTYK